MSIAQLKRNTVIGLALSLLLAGGKFVAGLLGHSSALVADGVESLADTVGSIVVWQGFRVASRDPDDRHPYGYGRAETVAAFSVGTLLVGAAVVIVIKAFAEMFTPHTPPASWTLFALVGVIAAKEVLFRVVLRGAEMFDSDAARADAWHHRADAITSAVAIVGVAIAIWGPPLLGRTQLVFADEVAAILAAGIILVTASRLIRPPLLELLDASPPDLVGRVQESAARVEGVRLVEKVLARKSGRGYHIDMHLHVPPDMPVRDAHILSGKVKARIRAEQPRVLNVLIHIEPDEKPHEPA
ncbi:MAG: cation diffusion facilitator family transporter [Planctomycetota bacterium]|nr:cation diffusion facilitator family transporter [Planctomycetota bacterium]